MKNLPRLTMVEPPKHGVSRASRESKIAELKSLLTVGLEVDLENGATERLVRARVVEINADNFRVQHGQGATISKFENADFVVHKNSITLLDQEHLYAGAY